MIATLGVNVVLTALFSATLTWAAAYWYFRNRVQSRLHSTLEQLQVDFEQRVKSGVLAAGEELLPKLREQVKLGFQDALRQSRTGEMVEGAAGMVNLGADLVTNGLAGLFGIKPKK